MDSSLIAAAAQQLRDAAETGAPCGPIRDVLRTSSDVDAAYAVQQHMTGSLGPMRPVSRGDALRAWIDGLGAVSVHL